MMLTPQEAQYITDGLVIPVFKPLTWTSFQAVKKVKSVVFRALDARIKIGHAGTLDPLAEGLLLICTGKATKSIDRLQEMPKVYSGTIRLGATTPSFDLESEVDQTYPIDHITLAAAEEAAKKFIGPQMQMPPVFSARWVDGQRSYTLARQGLMPEMAPRPVIIESFEITRFDLPEVDFRIVCSKGTYIRSLARDFGKVLGSGGHLTALCRDAIGPFDVEHSCRAETITIEDVLKCEPWPLPIR